MNGGPAISTVNLVGSQSYNYAIPILGLPGRGGLDLALNLYYNSRIWDVDTINSTITLNADRDFPSYGFRLDFGYIEYDSADDQYILTEADGTKRALPNISGYQTNDGSFISYSPTTRTLTYSTGTTVTYAVFPSQANITPQTLFRPVSIKTTNGNFLAISYVNGQDQFIQTVTDTVGRVIWFNYDSSSRLSSITQNVQASTVDPNGIHTYATFAWGAVPLNYSFASGLIVNNTLASGTSINVITSCIYANGTGYKFSYGDWGIVKRIDTLSSTGATRSYVSYNFPLASAGPLSDAPAYTQETVSPDGTNTFNWNYSVTKSGIGSVTGMTVTDPNGNSSVSSLDGTGLLSSVQRQNSAGAALRTIAYVWSAVGASASPVLSGITTTLNDTGQQSSVSYAYDSNGNPTDVFEKDFDGQVKRETVMTYAGGAYITQHILNLPTQIVVKDGPGNAFERTDLAYDTTTLTPIAGATNHDDQNFGSGFTTRGNLTSVTRYSHASAGTGGVTRTFNYDSLGNLILAQLDCCSQETFNFSSITQYAYADSIVRGPGPGPQFTITYTYNKDKGLKLSGTDENGQVVGYQYDSMNRMIQATPPSPAGVVSLVFGDSALSPTLTTSNSTNSLVEVQTFDGLGRLVEVDDKNGSTLVSSVTHTYNGLGQNLKTSNPFGPGETSVYTNFVYDAMGRVTQVSPPSAGSIQYQYSGNAVTITDPSGKQLKKSTDALGRVTEVDEPGGTFAGSQSSGTLTINGALRSQAITGTYGSGSITVSGFSDSVFYMDPCTDAGQIPGCPTPVYDYGSVFITVNGHTDSASYGQSSSPTSIANDLANAINNDAGAFVNASASNGVLSMTARQVGAIGNYSWSLYAASGDTTDPFDPNGSFANPPSSGSLSSGADGQTVWDSGTVSVRVGSFTASASYGQGGNASASQVAFALVGTGSTGLNRAGSPVRATASGANITLTYNSVGSAGNVTSTASSTPNNSSMFPGGSFGGSTTLGGGQDSYTPGLAHPFATTYAYDPLGNITSSSQAAGNVNGQPVSGQPRSFTYDSLSRLITATNPESGTVTNYYTNASGGTCAGDPRAICRTQDARGIVKTFSYDGITRLTGVSYSDGTPGQTFTYDTGGAAAFAMNRLIKITEGPTNSQTLTYDNLGRVTAVSQVIDGATYSLHYGYNAASEITSITYPTNRVVSQAYDAIGRLSSIADGTTTYLNGLSYNAAGQALGISYGNGVQGLFSYNDHLQASTLRYYKPGSSTDVLNLSYDYGTSNNGQIQAIHYYTSPTVEDTTKSEYFSYDPWSRLSTAHTGTVNSIAGTWSLNWVYDRLGNRLQQNLVGGNTSGTSIGQPQWSVDPNTNRITNTGFQYDASGNLTADGTNTYAYDATSRIKQLNGTAAAYTYFGPYRIKKVVGTTTTIYVYSGSKPIAEYVNGTLSKEYIYTGFRLLATVNSGGVTYHHPDNLSNRAETDSTGTVVRTFGHAPFGELWYETGTADKWKFTSYERDSESGLDYAQFRFYASGQGRFTSCDRWGGHSSVPQSLNRYSYVGNDPINDVDPDGQMPCFYVSGINTPPGSKDSLLSQFNIQPGIYTYAGGKPSGIGAVISQDLGGPSGRTAAGATTLNNTLDPNNSNVIIAQSGGAQIMSSGVGSGAIDIEKLNITTIIYLSPGTGLMSSLPKGLNNTFIFHGTGPADVMTTFAQMLHGKHGIGLPCSHGDLGCFLRSLRVLLLIKCGVHIDIDPGPIVPTDILPEPIQPIPTDFGPDDNCGDDCGDTPNLTPRDDNGRPQLVCRDPNGCSPDVAPQEDDCCTVSLTFSGQINFPVAAIASDALMIDDQTRIRKG